MDTLDSSPAPAKHSGLATTSLVLGILGIIPLMCCCSGALLGIPAVITGHVSRGRIKSSGGTLTGGGVALGGLITGYISIALTILSLIVIVPNGKPFATAVYTAGGMVAVQEAARQTESWPADEGITNAKAYVDALVKRKAVASEQASMINLNSLEIGNVSGSDPGTTILVRSRPGVLPGGYILEMLKNGTLTFVGGSIPEKGTPPPRDPQFLAD